MIYFDLYFLLLIISGLGALVASYLIKKRIAFDHPICPIGGNCQLVLTSKYNKTFGLHNDLAGLLFYVAFVLFSIIMLLDQSLFFGYDTSVILFSRLGLLVATLMSVRFIYIQLIILRTWCFWCLISSLLVFLMDLVVINAIF